MKVVILAGGLGTRLAEETETRPKPMVEIGVKPILWHIMKHYGRYGFNEFYIALGYKGEAIKRFFLDHHTLSGDITVNLATGEAQVISPAVEDWTVHLVDTGEATLTGGRVKRLEKMLGNGRRSCSLTATASATSLSTIWSRSIAARTASRRSPPCARLRASAASTSTATAWPASSRKPRSTKGGSTVDSWCSSPGCSAT